MLLILAILLLVLILGGLGFLIHVIWWAALILLIAWLIGLALRSSGSSRSRR